MALSSPRSIPCGGTACLAAPESPGRTRGVSRLRCRASLTGPPHTAASAERWAAQCAGWGQAPACAIDAFAAASARLFAEIAGDDPQPWKQQLAGSANRWMTYRANGNWGRE
jgi:hypothetical protein